MNFEEKNQLQISTLNLNFNFKLQFGLKNKFELYSSRQLSFENIQGWKI